MLSFLFQIQWICDRNYDYKQLIFTCSKHWKLFRKQWLVAGLFKWIKSLFEYQIGNNVNWLRVEWIWCLLPNTYKFVVEILQRIEYYSFDWAESTRCPLVWGYSFCLLDFDFVICDLWFVRYFHHSKLLKKQIAIGQGWKIYNRQKMSLLPNWEQSRQNRIHWNFSMEIIKTFME